MEDSFFLKKKLLMEINSDKLNKNILYLINEARTSPKQFSQHLIYSDYNNSEIIKNLSFFFRYYSKEVYPLILDKNLSICSQDLLTHLILIDDGNISFQYNQEEIMKNNLIERLRRLNLISNNYNHFIVLGVDNCLEAIINLFLNEDYKNKILSPEMNYIGIASGLLPSDNLCIIIDIVNSLKNNTNFNYKPFKGNYIKNINNDKYDDKYKFKSNYNFYKFNRSSNYLNNKNNYLSKNYSTNNINNFNSNKKKYNMKKIFNSREYSPSPKMINKNVLKYKEEFENDYHLNNEENIIFNREYKIPINVYIDKQYIKSKEGKIIPIYTKKLRYDDGSILIQPNINKDDENFD